MKAPEFLYQVAETEREIDKIKDKEHNSIRERRKKVEIRTGAPDKDAIGLCLSGGGVRSATFNLGLLQAFDDSGFLKWVDYISTVSGGGYIGSSLSWFKSNDWGTYSWAEFPFRKNCNDEEENRPLRWLRRHSSYLAPGDGLDIWALFAAILRGIFINIIILVPVLFGLMYCLTVEGITDKFPSWMQARIVETIFDLWPRDDLFPLFFTGGVLLLLLLVIYFFIYALISRKQLSFKKRRRFSVHYGRVLKAGFYSVLLGLLPLIDISLTSGVLENWRAMIISSVSLTGAISFIAGWVGLKEKDETRGIRAYLLRSGLILIMFVLLLLTYQQAVEYHKLEPISFAGIDVPSYVALLFFVLLSAVVGMLSDINHVSMHRYYRDRLLEAYMPKFLNQEISFKDADKFNLTDIKIEDAGAPYHIINSNLSTSGSEDPKYRARGGASFIFSPHYVGSDATGYRETTKYINGQMSLATAFSISGAAVDPNTGATRSRPLAFLMTLLNVRLGYWALNPKHHAFRDRSSPPFWHYYSLREMLGWRMNEEQFYVHLSDGGHFENLGLYELVRRKCPFIIISDATADPKWTFKDLARACELVRADFCAEVEIDTRPLHPDKQTEYSDKAYVYGEIIHEDNFRSKVIYVKTAMTTEGLPEDLHGYNRAHPEFPDESTADQFFDEMQFEAYRELGYRIGKMILINWEPGKLEDTFTST